MVAGAGKELAALQRAGKASKRAPRCTRSTPTPTPLPVQEEDEFGEDDEMFDEDGDEDEGFDSDADMDEGDPWLF